MNPPRHIHKLLVAAITLGIGGCSTAPEQQTAPELGTPPTWTADTQHADGQPLSWLADFKDPALNRLVGEALQNNPSLQITAARLNQAIAEARIAGADLVPSANLGLDASRRQINSFGPATTGNTRFEDYGLNLNIRWEVDVWGKLRDRSSAARAQVDASHAELQAARHSLAAQVVKSWFNYVEAQAQLELAQDTAEAYHKNTQTLEARFKRGLSEGLDLRRLRTQAAGSDAAVQSRRRGLDQAARNLEIILGRYPSAKLKPESELGKLPDPVPVGLPSELITRRPDLRAAERRLAASDQELLAAQKELLPSIALTASGGNSSQEFKDIFNSNFFVWNLAANAAQPVFQGGRIRANIDRSASLRDQALFNYRDGHCSPSSKWKAHSPQKATCNANTANYAPPPMKPSPPKHSLGENTAAAPPVYQRARYSAHCQHRAQQSAQPAQSTPAKPGRSLPRTGWAIRRSHLSNETVHTYPIHRHRDRAWRRIPDAHQARSKKLAPERALTRIKVITAQPETVQTIRSQGTVLPTIESDLSVEVSGRIIEVSKNFRAGSYFKKGELLLSIERADYEAALAMREADLASARLTLAQEEALAAQALEDWQSMGSGEASALTLRKPQLAQAKAMVKSAEASVSQAERDLDRTRITAPYDGLVLSKNVDLGQYVVANPANPIARIYATELAEVRLPIALSDAVFSGRSRAAFQQGHTLSPERTWPA